MPLISCAECAREISDQAASCPACGAPNRKPAEIKAPDPAEPLPGYRHVGAIILLTLLFAPAAWLILWTGPVYYDSKGVEKRVAIGGKLLLMSPYLVLVGLFYLVGLATQTYEIQGCADETLIDTIKKAAAESRAGQLGFRIVGVTDRRQLSWSETTQTRICHGHAYTSTGEIEIRYTASWIDRDKGQIYVKYQQEE